MPIETTFNLLKQILSMAKNRDITRPIVAPDPEKPRIREKKDNIEYFDDGKKEIYDSFISECELDDSIKLNRFLLLSHGKAVYSWIREPYDINSFNYCFSLTKSVIGLGIGLLYDEGKIKLNDYALKILLPKYIPANLSTSKITIRHLLTMATGSKFNEVMSAVSKEWVKDFFNSGTKFKIGTSFDYNSLNSYILSAIIDKVCGSSAEEYLKEKLFNPLDITDYIFEKSPEGIEKGGWGIYLAPYDMAKLGLLISGKGIYNGKRIISEKWINMMTSCQNPVKMPGQDFDYGYQIWNNESKNVVALNGMFNQDVVIYKNTGYICAWCCSNNDGFHTNNVLKVAEKYFNNKEEIVPVAFYRKKELYSDSELRKTLNPLFNNKYILSDTNKGYDTTVLPIVVQMALNEYATGLKSVSIKETKNDTIIKFTEVNEKYELRFNYDSYTRQTLSLYGNIYDVAVKGYLRREDNNDPYLLVKVCFLEFASVRYLKFSVLYDRKDINLSLTENPGYHFLENLMLYQDAKTKELYEAMKKRLGEDTIETRIRAFLYPSFNMMVKPKKQ